MLIGFQTFPILDMLQLVGHSLHHLIIGIFILWVVGVKCGLASIKVSGHPSGR